MAKGFRSAKSKTKAQIQQDANQMANQAQQQMQGLQQVLYQFQNNLQQTATGLRMQLAKYAELLRAEESQDACEEGDQVVLDFLGRKKNEDGSIGDPFEGGYGPTQVIKVDIGSNGLLPDFTKNLVGLKPGESKEFDLTFPENYGANDLRGKTVSFLVEIIKVYKDSTTGTVDALYQEYQTKQEEIKQAAKKAQQVAEEARKLAEQEEASEEVEETTPQTAGEAQSIKEEISELAEPQE